MIKQSRTSIPRSRAWLGFVAQKVTFGGLGRPDDADARSVGKSVVHLHGGDRTAQSREAVSTRRRIFPQSVQRLDPAVTYLSLEQNYGNSPLARKRNRLSISDTSMHTCTPLCLELTSFARKAGRSIASRISHASSILCD